MDESSPAKQAQTYFRECIDGYERLLARQPDSIPLNERMTILRQLSGCYFKLQTGDKKANLTKALRACMDALEMARSLSDVHMIADLTGKLGSYTFELGAETDSVNLVHEAISYHLESAALYSNWPNYWQQEAMHYGYAAYSIESLPDGDTTVNAKLRAKLYEKLLACLPNDVPQSYVEDINERLKEAKNRIDGK